MFDNDVSKLSVYKAFVLGFLTGYLSMTVEASMMSNDELSPEQLEYVDFGSQYFYVPMMYGLVAVCLTLLVTNALPESLHRFWVIGLGFGLIIPAVKLIDNYAIKVYDVTPQFLYVWDAMVYTAFWGIVLGPLSDAM